MLLEQSRHTEEKKNKARRTLGEREGGGGGGGVEGSGRSGLMHCYLACSSSSRHSSSVFKPEHRGCLAPGHCCQRLENSRVSRFSKPLLYSGAFRKKIALLYSLNRRHAQFGLSRSGTADGQQDGGECAIRR